MNIYTKENSRKNKYKQRIKNKLTAMNGKSMDAEIVFIAVFKHIKEQVFTGVYKELKRRNIDCNINTIRDIQWIVTVPAIWDDTSKDKMITWIEKAGLIDPNIENHCLLKYEPDCASLSLQFELLNKKLSKNKNDYNWFNNIFNKSNDAHLKGSKYILIDAGGGTVDIACHQFMENYSVKELFYPTGGPWGDMNVTQAFENILKEIFGKDTFNNIKNDDENAYFDLIQNFRIAKIGFYDRGDGYKINVKLPPDFIDGIYREIGSDKLHKIVNEFEYDIYKNCFKFDDGYLGIDCLIWKDCLFDPYVNKVIKHLKKLLKKSIMQDCKYIYLVGGYSQTPYFQERIKHVFGKKLKIIIPKRPILSVVDGAARMGSFNNIDRTYIQSRIVSKTYGCSININQNKLDLNQYPKHFVNKNTQERKDGTKYLHNCFEAFVRKEDCVPHNSKFIFKHKRKNTDDTRTRMSIYWSDDRNPKICDKSKYLCKYIIEWPKNDESLKILTEVTFGDTMMKMVSYPENYPQRKFKSSIEYGWKRN